MSTETETEPLGWCVVANVATETANGPGGLEIRAGVRHFPAGAKVWVLPPMWANDSDRLMVVGHHRGRGHRLVRVPVLWRHLTGFRVRMIYSPAVMRAIQRPARGSRQPWLWNSRAQAQEYVDLWSHGKPLEGRLDDSTDRPPISDPPPPVLDHKGQTYHLAHFNAYRARYSVLPPPSEAI
jgi:hypothetical protein